MAQEGGIGVIHKNLSIEAPGAGGHEGQEVRERHGGESGDHRGRRLAARGGGPDARHEISGIPVVSGGKLVGILTHRDLRFEKNLGQPVSQ